MWVVATLYILIVLIILALCVPLDIAFHIDICRRPRFKIRLTWLFGLISKEIRKGKKKPKEKRKRRERWRTARTIFEILRTKGLVRKLKNLGKDILRRLEFRELRINYKVGLGNLADTALLFGPISAAILFLSSLYPRKIVVQPSFDIGAACECHIFGEGRLRPIRVVIPLIRFAFSRPTIRAAKILIQNKWRRKKK